MYLYEVIARVRSYSEQGLRNVFKWGKPGYMVQLDPELTITMVRIDVLVALNEPFGILTRASLTVSNTNLFNSVSVDVTLP